MPYFSTFLSGLFHDRIPDDDRRARLRRRVYSHYLTALYRLNLDIFRAFSLPPWAETQVQIEAEMSSPCTMIPSDVWLDALSILKNGSACLKDVSCYRAAYNVVHRRPFERLPFGNVDDALRPMSTFVSGLFNGDDPRDKVLSQRAIGHYLDALFQIDLDLFRAYKMPPLYEAGVRYQSLAPPCKELPGDLWLDALSLLATKEGDCKDLSCYLAAQRTVYEGRPCRPATLPPKFLGDNDFSLYHIVVLYNDGTVEDPSAKLGMKSIMDAVSH